MPGSPYASAFVRWPCPEPDVIHILGFAELLQLSYQPGAHTIPSMSFIDNDIVEIDQEPVGIDGREPIGAQISDGDRVDDADDKIAGRILEGSPQMSITGDAPIALVFRDEQPDGGGQECLVIAV